MIYQVWSAKLAPEIGDEAQEFAKKMAKCYKETNPHTNNELLFNLSGPQGRVHWVSKHESWGAMQEDNKKGFESEAWKSLMDEMQKAKEERGGTILFIDVERHFYSIADL